MQGTIINFIKPYDGLSDEFDYIAIINPEKKPPHLAFVQKNTYYSLSNKGVEVYPFSVFEKWMFTKDTSIIFLEISSLGKGYKEHILRYNKINGYTCLHPIKSYLFESSESIETIHDLIPKLNIKNILAFNYKKDTIIIPYYSINDVNSYIESLGK